MWLVVMMVCEHKAHSWSVSCPSFFFPFYVARFVPTLIHILPPTINCALLFAFFFLFANARTQAAGHEAKARLFFPFSFSLLFLRSLSISLCYATLWSNTTASKSVTTAFQSKKEKKSGRQRWHVYIIIFRSLNTKTK